jgi:plasmid stability protein
MSNLSIRKLDPVIYKRLRLRAQQHGVSMEEEVRRILAQSVMTSEGISETFQKYFGELNGIDLDAELDLLGQRAPHKPLGL